eukprot:TRINITY_DN34157_c0_g1_i1.p2 TRINITY_DN34157_c0_g1~~TRINITY_DN34157_c0_g1_i1.p2  ORF type:complete len:178 (-),score=45.35 TRINITY_DN34157_c0_g1_i1:595-1128(-)
MQRKGFLGSPVSSLMKRPRASLTTWGCCGAVVLASTAAGALEGSSDAEQTGEEDSWIALNRQLDAYLEANAARGVDGGKMWLMAAKEGRPWSAALQLSRALEGRSGTLSIEEFGAMRAVTEAGFFDLLLAAQNRRLVSAEGDAGEDGGESWLQSLAAELFGKRGGCGLRRSSLATGM